MRHSSGQTEEAQAPVSSRLQAILTWWAVLKMHPQLPDDVEVLRAKLAALDADLAKAGMARERVDMRLELEAGPLALLLVDRYAGLTTISPSVDREALHGALNTLLVGADWHDPSLWLEGAGKMPEDAFLDASSYLLHYFYLQNGRLFDQDAVFDHVPDPATDLHWVRIKLTADGEKSRYLPWEGSYPEPLAHEIVQAGGIESRCQVGAVAVRMSPGVDEEAAVRAFRRGLQRLKQHWGKQKGAPLSWRSDSYERHMSRYMQWVRWEAAERAAGRVPSDTRFANAVTDPSEGGIPETVALFWPSDARDARAALKLAREWLAPREWPLHPADLRFPIIVEHETLVREITARIYQPLARSDVYLRLNDPSFLPRTLQRELRSRGD